MGGYWALIELGEAEAYFLGLSWDMIGWRVVLASSGRTEFGWV